jgi:hypothetical protein
VIIEGEDHTVVSLDREPILPVLLGIAAAIGAPAVAAMLIAALGIEGSAFRRRRALERPWRRVRIQTWMDGETRHARITEDGTEPYWRIDDAPGELPLHTIEAQVAGTRRRLAVRRYGSTQLMTARRRRPTRKERVEMVQPTGESAMSAPRCTSVGVSDPRSSSSCLASRK